MRMNSATHVPRSLLRGLPALLILLAALPASAEIHKWTDAQGRVHFGDKPTDSRIQSQEVQVHDYKPGADADTRNIYERRQRLLDAGHDAKKSASGSKTADSAAQARQRECTEARERIQKISGRVVFQDAEGNTVQVTEQQRMEKQRVLENWLRENCQ